METDNMPHRPLTPDDWEFILGVLEGTKLDVPRIRIEVSRLSLAEDRADRFDRFEDWLADRAGPLLHIDDVRQALA